MTDDVKIRIGADASDVPPQTNVARAAINTLAMSARSDAQIMAAEFAKMNASLATLREQLRGVGTDTGEIRSIAEWAVIIGIAKAAWDGMRASVEATATALNAVKDAAESAGAATNRWVLSQLKANDTIREWLRSAEVYRSGVLQTASATIALSGNIDRMTTVAQANGFENLTRYLQALTTELSQAGKVSVEDAAKIVAAFASIPDSSGQLTSSLTTVLAQLDLASEQAKELAARMTQAFADPQTHGAAFLSSLRGVSTEMRTQFDEAARANSLYGMRSSLLLAMVEQERLAVRAKIEQVAETEATYRALGRVGNLLALGNREYQNQRAEAEKMIEKLREQEAQLDRIAGIIRNTTGDMNEQRAAAERVMATTGNYSDRLTAVRAKIAALGAPRSQREVETARALADEENRIKDAQEGGNAVIKDRVASLQQEIEGHRNSLAAAQSAVEAQQKIVDRTRDEAQKTQETLTLLQLKKSVMEQTNRLYVLGLEAQKGAAVTADDKRSTSLAVVQAKRKGAGDDPIELQQLKNEELAIEREYADAKARIAADDVNRRHRDAISELHIERQVLEEKQQLGQISRTAMYAGELALEERRAALERKHLEELKEIYGEGTAEYRKALLDEEKALRQVNQRKEQITRQSNAAVHRDYVEVFQSIGSSISNSLMGIIQGTNNFRGLMRAAALDVIRMFVDAGIKMVANWAASQAQKIALHIAAETGMTAATTAGNAARTASNTAAAAGDLATKIGTVIKSIMTSAAETFAGIFGFMAPLMGPAAAGPAAAGMATVAGMASVASFDTGAWQIPHDQLAMVHKNELIMTASQGEAFRGLLQGGGSGAKGPGGPESVTLAVSAVDAQSVHRLFKDHGRQLAAVLRDVLNANPSLRASF